MSNPVIGILGGGQLGRMLLQSLANYAAESRVLESTSDCPSATLCSKLVTGSYAAYDEVLSFGQSCDVLTIEIEHVNTNALRKLKAQGKRIVPDPEVIAVIQDKGLQKQFLLDHQIPTSDFILLENGLDKNLYENRLPAALKLRKGGYDGKGVQLIRRDTPAIDPVFDAPCVLEQLVDIELEIAVMVAVDMDGIIRVFPPVEMVFDPELNLVDYLIAPADLPEHVGKEAEALAIRTAQAFGHAGLYAIEMFYTTGGKLLVNEVAPRPHNSGHQTIEGNYTSQFDALSRILLGLRVGNTQCCSPSLMLNLIGAKGHSGPVRYEGLDRVSAIDGVYVHLYGKKETRPGRKMGHVTLLARDRNELLEKAEQVKQTLSVKSTTHE